MGAEVKRGRASPRSSRRLAAHHNPGRPCLPWPQNADMRLTLLSLSLTLACGLWAQDPFQVKVTGHGRPMILIPGLSSSGETWDTTVARYQDRFQCHVLTLAGFAGVPRISAPMLEIGRASCRERVQLS